MDSVCEREWKLIQNSSSFMANVILLNKKMLNIGRVLVKVHKFKFCEINNCTVYIKCMILCVKYW